MHSALRPGKRKKSEQFDRSWHSIAVGEAPGRSARGKMRVKKAQIEWMGSQETQNGTAFLDTKRHEKERARCMGLRLPDKQWYGDRAKIECMTCPNS